MAEWQTRLVEGQVSLSSCEFDSHRPHQLRVADPTGGFFVLCPLELPHPERVSVFDICITERHYPMRRLVPFLILSIWLLAAACASFAQAGDKTPAADEVQAEFAMPIYRNPSKAELTVVVPKAMAELRAASVSVVSPEGKEVWNGSFRLSPGRNACVLKNIGSISPGRYMATVTVGKTSMKRMLRIERIPAMSRPTGPIGFRKIFFTPDDWLFKSIRNLEIRYSKPKLTEAYHSSSPDVVNLYGSSFGRTVDGTYVIRGVEHPYRRGYLYSSEPRNFTVQSPSPDGPYVPVETVPKIEPSKDIFKSYHILGWADGGRQYEMYDPATHGTYALSDIGIIQNIEAYDFGCVKAGYRTYWVVANTSSGKTVFLRNTPLFRDVPLYGGDDFDNGFTTNDNFGNSWLSEDGKTLYLARGQTVRRFAPYDVPYDLLPNSSRILTIYSTADGVDWHYCHSISSCGPIDDPFSQQYGADIQFLPDAGLHLAFVNAYDSKSQQIYLDLKYSRDGINFYDFTDPEPFAKTANPFDWYFGELFTSHIVQVGNRYYQLASGSSLPHYFAEPLFRHNSQSEITAEDFKSLFANRRFAESLPYFESLGGWEGLAKHARNGHYSVGVMSYRADGWFGVRAGSREGVFVTRPIKGGGALSVNACVAKGGLLCIELLDAKGRVLRAATIRGDSIKSPVFAMPEGDFCLRVTMRRTDLYTMYIEPRPPVGRK